MIFDPQAGRFKLIDLGAAADLRFGFNYQPKEFILDPRFSGPEEYIMSTQTPEAPATPLGGGYISPACGSSTAGPVRLVQRGVAAAAVPPC